MKNKIKEFLNEKERELLLAIPDRSTMNGRRDFCILAMLLMCGLRRAEICALKRKDLKVEGKKFSLHVFGKGSKWRIVPISFYPLIFNLERYWKKLGYIDVSEAPMFYQNRFKKSTGRLPITPEGIKFLVARYVKKAGITKHITPHSLRRTCLTNALQRGVDLATVKTFAGHSNISTTSKYLHTDQERMEMMADKLALG